MQPQASDFSHSVPVAVAPVAAPPRPGRRLRALHLVNGEHFSGAERVQSHLGRCLPRFGIDADFACLKPGRFADRLDAEQGRHGVCFRLGMTSRLDLGVAWRVRDLVRRGDYQLIHAHTPRTAMVAALASRFVDVPWIYHVHSPAARDSQRPWANRLNTWVESASLANCHHLITVSESLRRELLEAGFADDRVTVVHNGVPAHRPRRESTPVPGGPWTLGMVALLRPRKGLEVAIEAVTSLKRAGHRVTLRCIGPFETDDYERAIDARIDALGIRDRVERLGFAEDVPGELSRLDAMVLPSLFGEGLPMVVLEAMASGLPVIASRVEGTPEAVRDGLEGLLAEPGDPGSLAERIDALVRGQHDWHAMAEAATDRHARMFSDWAMAERTAAVYRQVVGVAASPAPSEAVSAAVR